MTAYINKHDKYDLRYNRYDSNFLNKIKVNQMIVRRVSVYFIYSIRTFQVIIRWADPREGTRGSRHVYVGNLNLLAEFWDDLGIVL